MHVKDCKISCAGQKCRMSLQDWNNKHAGKKLLDGITALYQYTCLTKKNCRKSWQDNKHAGQKLKDDMMVLYQCTCSTKTVESHGKIESINMLYKNCELDQ